jgi:hypothetical protein
VGLRTYYRIKASAAITKGQLVMFDGAVGASGVLKGKPATGLTTGQLVMGVAAMDIANNGFGFVTEFGLVRGINTTGSSVGETWADGDILYYNPAYTGGLTKVQPLAPLPHVICASVINAGSGGSGSLFVRVTFLPKVSQLTDVNVSSVGVGDVLTWDSVDQRWENQYPFPGYVDGRGFGGTVTQLTSKSTAVTLNSRSGQITMNNAALAAGASVEFIVNNSFVSGSESIGVAGVWALIDPSSYRIELTKVGAGAFGIRVTNITGGALSEALPIHFNIFKGATT